MATRPITLPRRGNPVAQSPLMRKGGVHQKSKSSLRKEAQRKTRKAVNEWYNKQ